MGNQPGIIVYRLEYMNVRNKLSQSQKGDLLDALMNYSDTGEEYQGDDTAVSIAFSFFAAAIRKSEQRYLHRCQLNAESSRKRWIKERETEETNGYGSVPDDANGYESVPDDANGYESVPDDANGYESVPDDANGYEPMPDDTDDCDGAETKQNKDKQNIEKQNKTKRKRMIYIPPTSDEVAAYCQERGNTVDPERFVDFYTARGWELKPGQKMKDWRAAVRTWEKNQKEWRGHEYGGADQNDRVRGQRELYGL